ncbi:Avr9/Cf-9 rapidly elicited protein 194 [Striga asiatica]|uniref:Avr9/Cf-9 rapidly elicited protein 194 n=1 Tax=Striga asiatica TaxID=4170 RepID=A0A5A7P1W2_STRAF|nr:Avr9/Cf-9 rapidly elicited protein 194 [Striga asiatica]
MAKTIGDQHSSPENPKRAALWDCGSSLYDSFELKSLEKQLDAAIASRTMSMPHLSDRRLLPPPPPANLTNRKTPSKISRSLHRLIRSVFGQRSNRDDCRQNRAGEGFYTDYGRSGALSTIHEGPEFDGLSPEIRSLVRRTASDRFGNFGSIGVY